MASRYHKLFLNCLYLPYPIQLSSMFSCVTGEWPCGCFRCHDGDAAKWSLQHRWGCPDKEIPYRSWSSTNVKLLLKEVLIHHFGCVSPWKVVAGETKKNTYFCKHNRMCCAFASDQISIDHLATGYSFNGCVRPEISEWQHPWKLTSKQNNIEGLEDDVRFNWMIFRFHVNFLGCTKTCWDFRGFVISLNIIDPSICLYIHI